jgi:hypothetical protein
MNRVLRPISDGIQLPGPDARACVALCRHPLLNVPGVHLLLVFNGTVEALFECRERLSVPPCTHSPPDPRIC